jgi:type IV pilus assembly protein PilY1
MLPTRIPLFLQLAMVLSCTLYTNQHSTLQAQLSDLIPDIPLFASAGVAPNIIVTLDDSGSMGSGYAPDSVGSLYSLNPNGSKRMASSDYNSIFYNPRITYTPPINALGQPYTTNFNAAKVNGFQSNFMTVDLATSFYVTYYYDSDTNYLGSQMKSYGNVYTTPAYYYLYDPVATACAPAVKTTENCYKKYLVSATSGGSPAFNPDIGADERQNFANWFSFYRTRNLLTVSASTIAFSRMPRSYRVAWQGLYTCNDFGGSNCANWGGEQTDNRINFFEGTHRDDFFKWVTKLPTYSGTPLRAAMDRAGQYLSTTGINSPSAAKPRVDADTTDAACRQNFHIMMTDGYWNGASPGLPNVDNQGITLPDGIAYTPRAPYSDNSSDSLSDIAFKYWANDLLPSIPNNVKQFIPFTGANAAATYWNARNDPATWQHMVNFTVGLGLKSALTDPSWGGSTYAGDFAALEAGTKQWPAAVNDSPGAVYDLWHAAVNSRGEFYSAENPRALSDAFEKIINRIAAGQGSGAAKRGSSARIRTDTITTEAGYDSNTWTGRLSVYDVNRDTGVETLKWRIDDTGAGWWPNPTTRKVYTWDITGSSSAGPIYGGVEFKWSTLSAPAKAAIWDQSVDPNIGLSKLGLTLTEANALGGGSLVDYIRGSQQYEQKNFSTGNPNAKYKSRNTALGDILSSSPIVLADQNYGHFGLMDAEGGGDTYATFVATTKSTRSKTIFVGANDGMLHAFNANNGAEIFAYVPNALHSRLWEHAYYNKGHKYFVDGKLEAADVYIGGAWKNYVFGSLGFGGNTIFAVDATNPNALNQNSIKWEITDPDLGKITGKPVIAKLNSTAYPEGRWVAIYGNGYESSTNQAKLFVVDVATGQYVKYKTCSAGNCTTAKANGLAQPLVIKNSRGINTVYSGDLFGNLWKFDLQNLQFPASTTPGQQINNKAYVYFVAKDAAGDRQAITAAPNFYSNPKGGFTLFVGTGRYFTLEDPKLTSTQTVYGVEDPNVPYVAGFIPLTRANLGPRTIVQNGATRSLATPVATPNAKGWFMDLPDSGERAVITPVLFFDKLLISTFNPATSTCNTGGFSWLMAIEPTTGTQFNYPVLDLNQDKKIDAADTGIGYRGLGSISELFLTFAATQNRSGSLSTGAPNTGSNSLNQNTKCSSGLISQSNIATMNSTQTLIEGSCIRNRMAWRQVR